MNGCVITLLFATALAHGLADAAYANSNGNCVKDGVILEVGEERQYRGECRIFKCLEPNRLQMVECCDESIEPPCRFMDPINPDAMFPECCNRHVYCPEGYRRKCKYGQYSLYAGETQTISGCRQLSCGDDGVMVETVCNNEGAEYPCRHGNPLNPNAAFPECCARDIVCPPGHRRKCKFEDVVMYAGDRQTIDGCRERRCHSDGTLVTTRCGEIHGLPAECSLGEVLYPNAEFPRCCEKDINCPPGMQLIMSMGRN